MKIEEAKGRLKNIAENAVEYDYLSWDEIESIETLLTAYEKQQKEIEELKKKTSVLKSYKTNLPDNIELICLCKNDFERNISDDYISKDKIKAKIEEYQNKIDNLYSKKLWNEPVDTINKNRYVNYINVLQSLLEEE